MAEPSVTATNKLIQLRITAKDYAKTHGLHIDAFTCDGCLHRFSCESVFDPYNIDGDCLEEK